MNSKMKSQLISDVLTGAVVAAAIAVVAPDLAFAQATSDSLAGAAANAEGELAKPFITVISYISYGLGAVMSVAGIAGAKKHADNPGSNPLGPALGRIGAGCAFLAAPYLIGALMGSGSGTLGATKASFQEIGGFN